ncbi:DUF2199 domain-containing protein, partial [Actinosynnema sp. NPDC020468]|uniref:DUF2199 domain-containing protein n=1 Tax=Actinosynnema sp. NPDC020468 TaxID=3154488 RepID=UPI00340C6D70
MSITSGLPCAHCGQPHGEVPFAYGTAAPAYWDEGSAGRPGTVLGDEQCVIDGEHFFVRARLVLPVVDAEEQFEWGVWVSLAPHTFDRMSALWTDPRRVEEPACFGWLSTVLPLYEPTTLNLKTMVHTGPVGVRPTVELEPTDHPLAVEQRTGITVARVREIAERLPHPEVPASPPLGLRLDSNRHRHATSNRVGGKEDCSHGEE